MRARDGPGGLPTATKEIDLWSCACHPGAEREPVPADGSAERQEAAVLEGFLKRLIRTGALSVRLPNGKAVAFGDGTGPQVSVSLTSWSAARAIATDPQGGLGDAYMNGQLQFEQGDIWDLLDLAGRNLPDRSDQRHGPLQMAVLAARRRLQQWNDRAAALSNVAHHYDISNDLYRRFLDADMQYSCAYWARPGMTLEEAQAAKKAHIAAKLRLAPGQKVLDIGCGWGGMALELAGRHGVEVLGITLSREQLALARERAQAAGLADRVRFELIDYRDLQGQFDRIVSVGMFEHVGVPNFRAYFARIRDLLTPDGVALVHTIGRRSPPDLTNRWVRRNIFPGGYIPALSETSAAIEQTGLFITDIEFLRLHYAETLKAWRERFRAEWGAVAQMYDERFCRMWEYYLASSELGFRALGDMNMQIQLARRVDALPLTRDYMYEAERSGGRAG
jgi:cyclopropane-fatty-acyl-phospholipid synthase